MYQEEKRALGISVLIAITGVVIQLKWECSNGFSRSGALIVCVGIYFGYLDLKRVYGEKIDTRIAEFESRREENDIVFSDDQLKDKRLKGSTDALKKKEVEKKEGGEKKIALVDALILALGTLIWGFGDIFFNRTLVKLTNKF